MLKILTILSVISVKLAQQEVVIMAQGKIRGEVRESYVSFRGIPYANVSQIDGRFKQAGLAPTWSGIRESHQSHCSETSRVEECLQLDVHVPTAGGSLWPVLVWVRGGSGRYNPGQLVQKGIIVIIVSHRLGPTGFLCLGEERIPGNAGVKDVVLALRWVRDNISAFKGNPHNVVVAGQSYGAAIVEALILSPMAQHLFHGVILQSGSILCPWAFNYDAKDRGETLRSMNEANGETMDVMRANIDTLVHNSKRIEYPYFPFAICAEKPLKYQEMLLSEPPHLLLSDKSLRKVPMIIGYNSNEAYVFVSLLKRHNIVRKIARDLSILLPDELKFLDVGEVKSVVEQIRNMYFKSNNFTMSALLEFHSDAYFANHVYRSVRLHCASDAPIYLYHFSHSSDLGVSPVHGVKKYGAAHCDELAYLFPESTNRFEGENAVVRNNLILLWTNFVKYLDPTATDLSTRWERLELREPRLLDISSELVMKSIPRQETYQMWDDIYDRFYYSRNDPSGEWKWNK